MKIALIYEKFISRGGLENYLYTFASKLVTDGHELEIITGELDSTTSELDRCRFHLIPRTSLSKFSAEAETTLAKIAADVSIGFGRTVAQDLHRAGGGCHKFYSEQVLHPLKRVSAKNRTELALERELYTSGKTKHFVVNSQMVAEQLQEAYGLSTEQLSVVHTAVDTERFAPAADLTTRKELRSGLEDDSLVYLFVSMNHRRKGLDALLEAWKNAPENAELWIVGPKVSRRYDRAIQKAGIADRVRQFVEPDDLVALYRAADVFVHPSLYDACANTALQSMACGLPGIISERDGARQFVEEGKNGLLLPHPSDPGEIADRIARIASLTAEERRRMGDAARETVLPLTWSTHAARWQEVISGL